MYDRKDFQAALRSVQRCPSSNGFRRGKKFGSIRLSIDHFLLKYDYLRKMASNRSKPIGEGLIDICIYIYVDESYVHHHHRVDTYNLYHPDDLSYIKSPHKGRRFCFVAAIRDDPDLGQGVWYQMPTGVSSN